MIAVFSSRYTICTNVTLEVLHTEQFSQQLSNKNGVTCRIIETKTVDQIKQKKFSSYGLHVHHIRVESIFK